MVLFQIMLCRVTLESVDEIRLKCDNSNQMKETEQYFAVVLFNMLYKEVLSFESFNEMLICAGHSDELCIKQSSTI